MMSKAIVRATLFLLGVMLVTPGCVIAPREGYYDHEHHRWYHEHSWVACEERDIHCH
jgi:hypothetical protein